MAIPVTAEDGNWCENWSNYLDHSGRISEAFFPWTIQIIASIYTFFWHQRLGQKLLSRRGLNRETQKAQKMILITQERAGEYGGGFMCFGLDFRQAQASRSETVHCCLNDADNFPFSVSSQQWSCRGHASVAGGGIGRNCVLGVCLRPLPCASGWIPQVITRPVNSCLEKTLGVGTERSGVGTVLKERTIPINLSMRKKSGQEDLVIPWSKWLISLGPSRIHFWDRKIHIVERMNEWYMNAWKTLPNCFLVPGIMPALGIINFILIYAFYFFFACFLGRNDSPSLFTASTRLYFQSIFSHISLSILTYPE